MWLAQPGSSLSLSLPFVSVAAVLANAIAASLEIVRARLSSPNLSLVLGGSFKPHTVVEAMAAAIRALGRAEVTKTNNLVQPEGPRGRLRGAAQGPPWWGRCCQLCRGMCLALPELRWRWEGTDGSWKHCLSWWCGAPFGSALGLTVRGGTRGMGAAPLPTGVCPPSVGHQDMQEARDLGESGKQNSLHSSPSPPPQQDTAGHQPNCSLCQNKN